MFTKGKLFIIALLISAPTLSIAQWPEVRRVTDSAEYAAMEPLVDSCISYLRNTLPHHDIAGRMDAVKFLDDWTTGVPYLLIIQIDYLFSCSEKNEELITQHVAGKLDYLRSHPEVPVNSFESELQGTLWMIDLYLNGAFVEIEKMEELAEMRETGTLNSWLKRQLPEDWITSE